MTELCIKCWRGMCHNMQREPLEKSYCCDCVPVGYQTKPKEEWYCQGCKDRKGDDWIG